jgi:hypothetical protein
MDQIKGHAVGLGQAAKHGQDTGDAYEEVRARFAEVSAAAQAVWGGRAKLAFARVAESIDGKVAANTRDNNEIAELTRLAQGNYIQSDEECAALFDMLA